MIYCCQKRLATITSPDSLDLCQIHLHLSFVLGESPIYVSYVVLCGHYTVYIEINGVLLLVSPNLTIFE